MPDSLTASVYGSELRTSRPLSGRAMVSVLDALRARRQLVSLGALGVTTCLAYPAAFAVSFGLGWEEGFGATVLASLLLLTALRIAAGYSCGLSSHRWRFVGAQEVRRLVGAVTLGSLFFLPLAWAWHLDPPIPATVLLLEPVFTLVLTAGLWLTYRTGFEIVWRQETEGHGETRRIIVVGAGEAGEALLRQVILHANGYRVVGFADDDPVRKGTSIHGIRVLGGTDQLVEITEQTGAEEIVIAVPSADPAVLRRIVDRCEPTGLPFRVLPGIAEVLDGDISLAQLREVRIEDLLGREPVELRVPELARDMRAQSVLITGAAGSIGSELARQCARLGPARLVLLDRSETGLFYLHAELKDLAPEVELVPAVADVVDQAAVERIFTLYRPTRVFHAAAYKHVSMMETNVREALRNNVIGTWSVASASGRHGVQKFVLVSTDKAVRPANVMGATKRAAEIVVLELQASYPGTAFGAVRFGNVLGSAGSVIPIFKRQLEEGKPLTVTHPEVTRYFMTIPEAAQLVLRASLLPELKGRVAMLDMGQPVRILDLARTLLRLSGGGRSREAIVFTGLRPGEKLHEELVAPGERTSATEIAKISILRPSNGTSSRKVLGRIHEWDRLLAQWNPGQVVRELCAMIPEVGETIAAADGRNGIGHPALPARGDRTMAAPEGTPATRERSGANGKPEPSAGVHAFDPPRRSGSRIHPKVRSD